MENEIGWGKIYETTSFGLTESDIEWGIVYENLTT